MKVLNFFRVALCALAVAFACSCEETKEVVITFPEATDVTIANGEEVELTFNAEAAWKLTVDKDWIVFVEGEDTFQQLTGIAGPQTIKITTKDVTSIFDEEKAVISIEMDSKVQPLYNITRTAVARWAKMFFGEYGEAPTELTADNPLVVEYNDYGDILVAINFQANFAWKVSSWPEWVDMETFSGEADAEVTSQNYKYFYVKESAYASAQTGEITITDMNGNNPFSFPIAYAGLPDDKIIIKNSEGRSPGVWGNQVKFAADQTEPAVIELSVMAKDNQYQVYYADWSMNPMTGSDNYAVADWINIDTTTPGTLKISVSSNTDKQRTAFVWVLPKAMFPEGQVDLDWYYNNYNESYMFAVEQESGITEAVGGFLSLWTQMYEYVEFVKFDQYNFDGLTLQDFGYFLPADNTYVYEIPEGMAGALGMHPIGFPAEWFPIYQAADGSTVNLYRCSQMGSNFSMDADKFSYSHLYKMGDWNNSYVGLVYMVNPTGPGKFIIEFYKDEAELATLRPSAAVILVKK